ncbi:hypothetical protein [Methylobacterium planeticum]|uniref:Uncharacterized protein n=1 Tax=Methylobacterium planeticum TaxID=2615211 RepID=A0A6N6MQY8_9HYPH|nr:hypothetical protein [Methylobacterium planeticum]KAB1071718.1 hypothetical protein F6X51_18045 [Methylobacterium planeticum]
MVSVAMEQCEDDPRRFRWLLPQVIAKDDQRVAAVAAEHQSAAWVGAIHAGSSAILVSDDRRKHPGPDDLPGCLRIRFRNRDEADTADTAATDATRPFMAPLPS